MRVTQKPAYIVPTSHSCGSLVVHGHGLASQTTSSPPRGRSLTTSQSPSDRQGPYVQGNYHFDIDTTLFVHQVILYLCEQSVAFLILWPEDALGGEAALVAE